MSRIVAKVHNLNRTTPIPKEGKQSKNYLFIGFVPSYELKNFDKYKEYLSAIYTETNDKGEKKIAKGTNEPDIRHYRLSGKYNKDEIDIDEDTYNIYTMDETSDYTALNSWRIFPDKFFDVIFLDRGVKGSMFNGNISNMPYPFQKYDHADKIYAQIYTKLTNDGNFYHQDESTPMEHVLYWENRGRDRAGWSKLKDGQTPLITHNTPEGNKLFKELFIQTRIVDDPIFKFRNPNHTQGGSSGLFKEYIKNTNLNDSTYKRLDFLSMTKH